MKGFCTNSTFLLFPLAKRPPNTGSGRSSAILVRSAICSKNSLKNFSESSFVKSTDVETCGTIQWCRETRWNSQESLRNKPISPQDTLWLTVAGDSNKPPNVHWLTAYCLTTLPYCQCSLVLILRSDQPAEEVESVLGSLTGNPFREISVTVVRQCPLVGKEAFPRTTVRLHQENRRRLEGSLYSGDYKRVQTTWNVNSTSWTAPCVHKFSFKIRICKE